MIQFGLLWTKWLSRLIFFLWDLTSIEDYARLYIREMVNFHGVPLSIIFDRGTQSTSQVWRSFLKGLCNTLEFGEFGLESSRRINKFPNPSPTMNLSRMPEQPMGGKRSILRGNSKCLLVHDPFHRPWRAKHSVKASVSFLSQGYFSHFLRIYYLNYAILITILIPKFHSKAKEEKAQVSLQDLQFTIDFGSWPLRYVSNYLWIPFLHWVPKDFQLYQFNSQFISSSQLWFNWLFSILFMRELKYLYDFELNSYMIHDFRLWTHDEVYELWSMNL